MSNNWENTLLSTESTIVEAIKILDQEALRIALVVDEGRRLLGTVTDGDIRRGLLRHITLEHPVSDVMNQNPRIGKASDTKPKLRAIMEEFDLLDIPIVEDGVLVGLETLHNLTKKKKYDNPVFLMAGGFGTRLRPLTEGCPKPLLKVGDKPILENILESFISYGFYKFYISTHYLPELIKEYFGNGGKWGVEIQYVYEENPLGTGGALGLLPDDMPELPIIMMNGDILTKIDFDHLLKYHKEHDAQVTMCVREYKYKVPYGVIHSEGARIISMVEKPEYKFFVNAGIYVINNSIVKKVEKNHKIDMPTLLEQHIENDKVVAMFPIHEYWLDIGKMNDFEQAQADFLVSFND